MSFNTHILNKPYTSRLTTDDRHYVRIHLEQEISGFESDTVILFLFWVMMPAARFFQEKPFTERMANYGFTLMVLLPFILLAGWLLYQSRIATIKRELKKNAKTIISTSIENIEVDKYNSVVLHTSYQKHRVFRLGSVIGTIKLNKPITISYLEGCDQVIDYDQ